MVIIKYVDGETLTTFCTNPFNCGLCRSMRPHENLQQNYKILLHIIYYGLNFSTTTLQSCRLQQHEYLRQLSQPVTLFYYRLVQRHGNIIAPFT